MIFVLVLWCEWDACATSAHESWAAQVFVFELVLLFEAGRVSFNSSRFRGSVLLCRFPVHGVCDEVPVTKSFPVSKSFPSQATDSHCPSPFPAVREPLLGLVERSFLEDALQSSRASMARTCFGRHASPSSHTWLTNKETVSSTVRFVFTGIPGCASACDASCRTA